MQGSPHRVLVGALACVVVLGFLGRNVETDLTPVSPSMPGSESAQAEAEIKRYFGDAAPFVVLLRGPRRSLDRQGPQLVRLLKHEPGTTTLSPWEGRSVAGLRPTRRRALILVDFQDGISEAVSTDVDKLDRLVGARIRPPVVATASSYASLLKGVKDASDSAAKSAGFIVFPALLLVLLFIFRAPLAAMIPLLLGGVTIVCARGILSLLSHWVSIDFFALPVSAMIGLALGVDYTLLMVSRFREELASGAAVVVAVRRTRQTAGRTVLGAGGTLFLSLSIVLLFVPGPLYQSVVGSMLLVTALSVLFALVVAPALLTLLGSNVDRWRLGQPSSSQPRWRRWVDRAIRRPGVTAGAIGIVMLLFALPALSLDIGPPGPDQLPKDNIVRRNLALVDHLAGPGWNAPFVVVASTEHGSIADPQRSSAIMKWQRQIAGRRDIRAVIGPSQLIEQVGLLRKKGDELLGEKGSSHLAEFSRLGGKLQGAGSGVGRLRRGLTAAAAGAGLLGDGSRRAGQGAAVIASRLGQASEGTQRAKGATRQLALGSERLLNGQRSLRAGALVLQLGLDSLHPIVAKDGLGVARPLRNDLLRRANEDPQLKIDADRADQLVVQLAKAKGEVKRLRRLATKLHSGLGVLAKGGQQLQHGVQRLASGSKTLNGGLKRLQTGSEQLSGGLNRLTGGANALESHLADGAEKTYPLQSGLRRAGVTVSTEGSALRRNIAQIREKSPGLFDTGQFALATVDGSRPKLREEAGKTIDLNSGQAVRMLVVPRHPLNSPQLKATYSALRGSLGSLKRGGIEHVGVAGGEAQLVDFSAVALGRFPLSVLAITIATFLLLVVLLRALLLAALAVLLNLASIAVAFGILALIANIPAGYPLGGHHVVDVTGVTAIFTVAFGLSIDYAVFLLTRMRESYIRDGDQARAIAVGLDRTGRVISGAAAIMAVVFLTFATAQVAFLSQVGVSLAVAVLLDATIVRLVLLPSVMTLCGDRVWWLPSWLERAFARWDGRVVGRQPSGVAHGESGLAS